MIVEEPERTSGQSAITILFFFSFLFKILNFFWKYILALNSCLPDNPLFAFDLQPGESFR